MIDMLRKYRDTYSLDVETEDGFSLYSVLEDEELDVNPLRVRLPDQIIESLPDTTNSKLHGVSPLMGEVNLSMRVIAIHLENGYSVKEISQMYYNEKSGRHVGLYPQSY